MILGNHVCFWSVYFFAKHFREKSDVPLWHSAERYTKDHKKWQCDHAQCLLWSLEIPHTQHTVRHQIPWSTNVCCGILENTDRWTHLLLLDFNLWQLTSSATKKQYLISMQSCLTDKLSYATINYQMSMLNFSNRSLLVVEVATMITRFD